jgi:hypothetical protein
VLIGGISNFKIKVYFSNAISKGLRGCGDKILGLMHFRTLKTAK